MVLTRLLKPDDFGIVGIIGSVFYTAEMFTDLGFQAFLVRHQQTNDRHFRDVIWTIRAKRGIALFALVAITSPVTAWLFGKPVIALPLAVASATFAFEGLSSLSLITALRRDKSRELSLFDLGLQFFQTAASIILAVWWRNAWALIAAILLQSATRSVLSYRLFGDSRQRLARDPAIAREFLAFSRLILVSSIITLALGQTDKLILARLFSLREFGLYALAVSIGTAPGAFVSNYITRVVFPIYASTWRERPAQLASIYYSVRRRQTFLYSFACGGLIGAAPLIIAVLYDPRYAATATYLSLIMISVALSLPNKAATELLTATGNLKPLVHVNLTRLIWLAVSIPVGFAIIGPVGVVAAVGLVEVPATIFNWVLLRKAGVLNLREELSSIALIAAGAAIGVFGSTMILRIAPSL
jgi:O-antigen/teichoic acid export membrane protein